MKLRIDTMPPVELNKRLKTLGSSWRVTKAKSLGVLPWTVVLPADDTK